jgi:hypothetical protein
LAAWEEAWVVEALAADPLEDLAEAAASEVDLVEVASAAAELAEAGNLQAWIFIS